MLKRFFVGVAFWNQTGQENMYTLVSETTTSGPEYSPHSAPWTSSRREIPALCRESLSWSTSDCSYCCRWTPSALHGDPSYRIRYRPTTIYPLPNLQCHRTTTCHRSLTVSEDRDVYTRWFHPPSSAGPYSRGCSCCRPVPNRHSIMTFTSTRHNWENETKH